MSIPAGDVEVPERVRALAGGAEIVPVWRNELGGVTFRAGALFIKHGPRHGEASMAEEAERLAWAAQWASVPSVLDQGETDDEEWLVTRAMDGETAVAPRWRERPATAVRAVAEGLRALHDALPVDACPFDWSVPTRIIRAQERGSDVPAALRDPPPVDRLVVCHGDACAPNTLIGDDGRWTAHVDLGALGTADRWADIAVATMSLGWNYGPGWDGLFLEAYGVGPDPVRTEYYRALWDVA
ncbi:aminoglycoside 3'-phosphotransferase [Microbacterium marinilacus]|uniref:Aminoglycoside 3'-phosphotransferase n=1 Tax=Microbacterium marinilacus TaxID=415209 RepID=A0ABP7BLD3_9MICO|nr:aminoglycoside 3'-phosphotransferase [Microbacterium marinilacus]MBY0689707.1 aminoglycoside 3'-phosphotransferase [Microbacterium marinilacus]